MTQDQAIDNLVWFIKNSNVDPDSNLYLKAIDSVQYMCECKMIHYRHGKADNNES